MKKNKHPKSYNVEIKCHACHHKFYIFSTKKEISVDICYKCHPFNTGKDKNLSILGRVDRFNKKYGL